MIHLTIDNHNFTVSKQTLEKFDFFKGLLEIQQNNLILDNINPITFSNMISTMENKDIIKDIAILSDQLGLNYENPYLDKYICAKNKCNNLALKNAYCNLHTCQYENCKNQTLKGYKYCYLHKCWRHRCNNIALPRYCEVHKCIVLGCQDLALPYYCDNHKCEVYGCTKIKLNLDLDLGCPYCEMHEYSS